VLVLCEVLVPPSMFVTSISVLPAEILSMIFSMMSNKDLAKVIMVCKRWREVGEVLWTWDMIDLNRGDLEMLGIKRLEHVEEISLDRDDWKNDELETVFKTVKSLRKLYYLDMGGNSLTSIETGLLVDMVTSVEFVNMSECEFTKQQLDTLLETMDETQQLKMLNLVGVNMSKVEPDILAGGLNRLEWANLTRTQLSAAQVTCLLRQAGSQTTLHTLWLDSNTIQADPILKKDPAQRVEAEIVELARQNIRQFNLKYCFDDNPAWTSYTIGGLVAYVANW